MTDIYSDFLTLKHFTVQRGQTDISINDKIERAREFLFKRITIIALQCYYPIQIDHVREQKK